LERCGAIISMPSLCNCSPSGAGSIADQIPGLSFDYVEVEA
jgi:hypothetical protein